VRQTTQADQARRRDAGLCFVRAGGIATIIMPETGPTATLVPDPGGATADLAVDRTTLPSG